MRKWRGCVLALALSVAAALAIGPVKAHYLQEERRTPPGVTVEKRTLVNVWMAGDMLGGADWVRAQAAQYAREHAGVNVWVRVVSKEDLALMAEEEQAAPDVILFAPGAGVLPETLADIKEIPVCASFARAGQWGAVQKAVPVYMAGYVLVMRTQTPAETPAPRSLFGVTQAPADERETRILPQEWPQYVAADTGFGALALGLVHVPERVTWADDVTTQDAPGLMLTTRQCAQLGAGFAVLAGARATDQAVYGAVARGASAAGEGFLGYLLGEEAQRALRTRGLLSCRAGVQLYVAGEEGLYGAQEALKEGWLPPAFGWEREKDAYIHSAQALVEAKSGTQALIK